VYEAGKRKGQAYARRYRKRGPLYLFATERVLRGERNVWASLERWDEEARVRGMQHGVAKAHDELFGSASRNRLYEEGIA
jgi:hypothetical protein